MNGGGYPFIYLPDLLEYEFDSIGSKGTIRKVVKFQLVQKSDGRYYELTFGDKVEGSSKINDLHISNNGDVKRVIATLIDVIFDFTRHHRLSMVAIAGSTPARCRLFRMQITNLPIIQQKLTVMGVRNGKVELFRGDINFDGFFIARRFDYNFDI